MYTVAALRLVSTQAMAYLDEVVADLNVHVALALLLGHWRDSHISKHTVSLSTAMPYSTHSMRQWRIYSGSIYGKN
jgi:predicted hydrolase (HD superfamily)